MRRWPCVCAAFCLLGWVGCDDLPVVAVEHDPAGSFSGLKSYRWFEDSARITADRPPADPELRNHVVRAVDRALAEKGFVLKQEGPVDLMVGCHIGKERRPDVRSMNAHYNYPPGWAWDYYHHGRDLAPRDSEHPALVLEDRGAVVIDVATAAGNRLLWRGTAYEELAKNRPAVIDQSWYDKRARELFAQFPPTP